MVLKKTPRDLSFKHCQAVKMCALKQQKLFIAIYIFPMFICTCVCICAYMCAVSKSLTYSDTFFLRALYFSFLLRCTSRHKARQHKNKGNKKYLCLPVTLINEAQYNYTNQVVYGNHLLLHGAIMWKKNISLFTDFVSSLLRRTKTG